MGELKTITKVPVGAVAFMGAVIYAILGLISGIISAMALQLASRQYKTPFLQQRCSAQEQASRLPLSSVAWFSASLAAILLWQL